jgi:KDO2-lipid IV(A) lauroyltransferase
MKLLLGRLLLGILAWLPLRAHRFLARAVEPAVRRLGRRKQAVAENNLETCFPELNAPDRAALARSNRRQLIQTVTECGPLWRRDASWIQARIESVEGESYLRDAHASGRGVLMLGGHLGNWELAILFGSLRMPFHFLYKPPGSERLDRLLTERRSRFGARMVPTGGAAMRRVIRALRNGGAVGLLFDQLPRGGDYVQAPFFAEPTAAMTLPHRLIRTTGCEVVMGHCFRTGSGLGWTVRFVPVPGADDPDPVIAAAAMSRALEAEVRLAPEQYLWHYRRFERLDE